MTSPLTHLGAILAVAAAQAPDPDLLPPRAEPPRSVRDLPAPTRPRAIFTYTVDGACRVTGIRKLQGAAHVTWRDAEQAHEVSRETTVWRFVDGLRRQLRERRVKLMGEMIDDGELVCLLQPSGSVVQAWIERRDNTPARRRSPTRQPVPLEDGQLTGLGTFSVDIDAEPPAS